MKTLLALGLAVFGLGLVAAPALAWGYHGCCAPACCEPACCTPCVTYQDKVVTCYKPVFKTREVPCTVYHMVCHREDYERKIQCPVPYVTQENRTITVMTCQPREVVRQVTCCRMVPTSVTDPCTGCCYTCCKPETYVQEVKCTEYDQVPVKKDITVSVCHTRMEERTIKCCRIVSECKPETVVRTECYCEMQSYQVTVKVPVCTPCAAPCCQ